MFISLLPANICFCSIGCLRGFRFFHLWKTGFYQTFIGKIDRPVIDTMKVVKSKLQVEIFSSFCLFAPGLSHEQ